ncbi:MAG: winged helix-turn-helix domain-containing protein [Acidobacteriaceae bacterium]
MQLKAGTFFAFGDCTLDPVRRLLTCAGQPVALNPKTFDLLVFLASQAGRVVPKEEILRAVWPDSFVDERNLNQHVFLLRKALAGHGVDERLIVTAPGRGYQFAASVQAVDEATGLSHHPSATGVVVHAIQSSTTLVVEESSDPDPAARLAALPARLASEHKFWIPVAALVLFAAVAILYAVMHRQPPALHIVKYEQLTQDGHAKSIGGTDGSRVYFTEELPHSIAEVSVSGGAVEPIPVSLNEPWAGDISPDGSTMLVVSQSEGMGPADSLWSFRLIGRSLRRLAGGAIDSAWDPDGLRLAYGTATGDIFVIRSDGTEEHKLASPGGYIRSLAWAPDGSKIRFSKDGVLWEIASDGSMLHQVLPRWSNSRSQLFGQWAQDGRYYFVSDGQIWALDERSHFGRITAATPVELTFGPTSWDRPVPARDGRKIFAVGRTRRGELIRFDLGSKQFQPFLGGISAEFLTFTRDGKSVAWVTYPEGILWKAGADGSNPLQLASSPVYPKSLRWSPDGGQILFVDRTPRGTNGIYTIAADGGAPRQVLPKDAENETDPSWSPDGKRIVYSTCPVLGASSQSDLRILDLASGKTMLVPESKGLLVPHWSPDGKFISAMTLDAMSMKVLSMETGKWSSLDTGSVAFPEWSHDSRFIYYLRWKGDAALARIHPGDASPEILADLRKEHLTGFFTSWMSLDSSDAPLLLRDVGSDEIYALALEGR